MQIHAIIVIFTPDDDAPYADVVYASADMESVKRRFREAVSNFAEENCGSAEVTFDTDLSATAAYSGGWDIYATFEVTTFSLND